MKIVTLTGQQKEWKIKGFVAGEGHRRNSKLHDIGRDCIREVFPTVQFKEEVPIPTGKTTLFLDFYIPVYKIGVEVHGEQHFNFSLHFHQTRANFIAHKQRDNDKQEWCDINGITLVVLPYNEDKDEWKRRLYNPY